MTTVLAALCKKYRHYTFHLLDTRQTTSLTFIYFNIAVEDRKHGAGKLSIAIS